MPVQSRSPAISRQISTLEAEAGATLVRRVPQGAVLTDAGRLLVEHGTAILARLEQAESELQALLGLVGGKLRLPRSRRRRPRSGRPWPR